jgi:hypothetical protein
MYRRSGQNGRIERKGNVIYARFWLDVPGAAIACLQVRENLSGERAGIA